MGRRYAIPSRPHSWVERDRDGKFKNWVDRGRSLTQDRKTHAKNIVKAGYGHQGDQKRRNPFKGKPTKKKLPFDTWLKPNRLAEPKGVGKSSMPTLNLKFMKKILGR